MLRAILKLRLHYHRKLFLCTFFITLISSHLDRSTDDIAQYWMPASWLQNNEQHKTTRSNFMQNLRDNQKNLGFDVLAFAEGDRKSQSVWNFFFTAHISIATLSIASNKISCENRSEYFCIASSSAQASQIGFPYLKRAKVFFFLRFVQFVITQFYVYLNVYLTLCMCLCIFFL